MEFKKILISNKKELVCYKAAILELFEKAFSRKLSILEWEWAYIDNPNGEPVVSLYFHDNELIGHYGIIPIRLKVSDSEFLIAGLSMTTMVERRYRKYGVFVSQAKEVYSEATKLGYSLVYGFPNKNSAPGFMKRLDWVLDKSYVIASLNKEQIQQTLCLKANESMIEFFISDENQKKWRLSKPEIQYDFHGGNVTKKFGDCIDLLYFNGNCSLLGSQNVYNIITKLELCTDNVECVPYVFGYKLLDNKLKNKTFKVDLIMSDVF